MVIPMFHSGTSNSQCYYRYTTTKKLHLLIQPLLPNDDLNISFIAFQDSFEDDKSKILMILCASPDPKELHKTVSTLEYGAKAKCIVRAAHATTPRDKMSSEESFVEENWLKVTS